MKNEDIDIIIANNFDRLLTDKKIKNIMFSKMVNMTPAEISAYRSGIKKIGKEMMGRFCDALNVRPFEFYREDTPGIVNEPTSDYTIPANCPAPPICQEICKVCERLHPDDQTRVKQLTEILTSDDKDTKDAIKSNLKAFYRDVKRYKQDRGDLTDFEIQESTGGALRGRTAKQD